MRVARPQTRGEEIANSVIHGFGLLASIVALPVLVLATRDAGEPLRLLGSIVFGTTMVLLYFSSTVYHALPISGAKRVFRVIDHSAIYLLIAGTYTPFALGPLRGPLGWTMFGVIWGLALLGITSKLTLGFKYPQLSTVFYLAMGWMGLIAFGPLRAQLPLDGLLWLLAGGLCYTGGVIFYVADSQVRYGHALWHLFVVAGTSCHFIAVLWHAVPPAA